MRTICERAWSPAWWVGVGVLFLAQRIDIRIYRVHTKDMTTTENIAADGSLLISFIVANFPRTTSFGDEVSLEVSGKKITEMRKAGRA